MNNSLTKYANRSKKICFQLTRRFMIADTDAKKFLINYLPEKGMTND